MNSDPERVAAIVNEYGCSRDSLVSILQDVQAEYRYLPEDALRMVALHLNLPLIQVYGVATFFRAFSLEPRGKHLVTVCLGTACHVRGAPAVLDEAKRELGVGAGETTSDMRFTLESVNCLGACALGPIMVIDGQYNGEVSPGKVKKILKTYTKAPKDTKHE
ncbi:MAG: NAD(P)H-dependent oxidoreductase subunit E [Chloroflexi bacterium]|nr:NAD(P)H-dependent oxidoreductase subunit E [Chloroflexota bacterium]